MNFQEPFKVYTAASNVEAIMIVEMLLAHGVEAHAAEDQSGVSLWSLGRISQFHQPAVWVDKSTAQKAAELILDYEEKQQQKRQPVGSDGGEIQVECEECGKTSRFSDRLNGTTQECSHCRANVDVGEFEWDEDLGEAEE